MGSKWSRSVFRTSNGPTEPPNALSYNYGDFFQNRLFKLKIHFFKPRQLSCANQQGKTCFPTDKNKQIQATYAFSDHTTLVTSLEGPNAKICRADFTLKAYFLKKSIFCVYMAQEALKML